MRVLTYSRVSTAHHEQNPEAQVEEMRRYCKARGWEISEEIIDHGYSGGTDKRPGLQQLVSLARSRKIDGIVVVKLDRLARSLRHLITLLDEFSALGVTFVSIGDELDLSTPTGRLMFHLVSAFAEFERALIRERTIRGINFARSKGKSLGRPKKRDDSRILELRQRGLSYRNIAAKIGCSMGAVSRALSAPKLSQKPCGGSHA